MCHLPGRKPLEAQNVCSPSSMWWTNLTQIFSSSAILAEKSSLESSMWDRYLKWCIDEVLMQVYWQGIWKFKAGDGASGRCLVGQLFIIALLQQMQGIPPKWHGHLNTISFCNISLRPDEWTRTHLIPSNMQAHLLIAAKHSHIYSQRITILALAAHFIGCKCCWQKELILATINPVCKSPGACLGMRVEIRAQFGWHNSWYLIVIRFIGELDIIKIAF